MSDQTRIGDTVSGDGKSPCPQPARELFAVGGLSPREKFTSRQLPESGEPSTEYLRYVKMLRPFPVRRLSDVLYHVLAEAAALDKILVNTMIDPPQTIGPWIETLDYLIEGLHAVAARADEARPVIEAMIDTADADAERGAVAARALDSMLTTEQPPPRSEEPSVLHEPLPCPWCNGHGGSVSDGACEYCQGSGIDPDDPASPL